MINFSNCYYLVILLYLSTSTCSKTEDSSTLVLELLDTESNEDDADDVSGLDLKFDPDVCDLPIDKGDCRNENLDTNENGYNGSDNVIDELNESNELNDSNENNTLYFGYNKSTKKCEEFYYEGCGGNVNRFDTIDECKETCYTPLKNFLAKVTDLLMSRVTIGTYELPTT